MSTHPSRVKVLNQHIPCEIGTDFVDCSCGEVDLTTPLPLEIVPRERSWAEHVADAWRTACTITTVEQLEALPDGSIVRGANGHAFEKSSESWTLADRRWGEAGNSSPDRSVDIPLPALLVWSPEWQKP